MSFLNVHYLISAYGYIGIFLIVFIESGVFFFLPGDSLLFTAGLLAASGDLKLSLILIPVMIAAFFGNLVGYSIGMKIESLKRYSLFRRILHDGHIKKAELFFQTRGKTALLLGRFVPGVRTFVPWVAGVARMDKKIFMEWSALGALIWVGGFTLAGYYLGKVIPNLEKYITPIALGIVFVSILPIIFEWWKGRSKKEEE
jgi:membrane-associated protein